MRSITISNAHSSDFELISRLIWKTMSNKDEIDYPYPKARDFLRDNFENTIVIRVNGNPLGAYTYKEGPNAWSLMFFSLDEKIRKTKSGYRLYLDLKKRLIGKPVSVSVYDDNQDMLLVVKKRGVFVGRVMTSYGQKLSFYSVMFEDFEKKEA